MKVRPAPRCPHRARALLGVAVASGVVVLVSACSSSPSGTAAAAPVAATAAPGAAQAPGVSGQTAAVAGSTLQVRNPALGQVTVDFTSGTRVTRQRPGTLSSVKVGDCLTAIGTPTGSTGVAATSVTISAPTGGSCTRTGTGFGGPGLGGFGGGVRPSGAPRSSTAPRQFASLSGEVTATSATSITVRGTLRSGVRRPAGASPAATPSAARPLTVLAVSVSAATTYSTVTSVKSSALAVGQCVSAIGPTDSIGTVTARTILIRPAGPNGCSTGRGFGRSGSSTGGANA